MALQRTIGNAAVGRLLHSRSSAPAAKSSVPVQRAVTVGTQALPRSSALLPAIKDLFQKEGVLAAFLTLNDDRTNIYIFESPQHLLSYLHMQIGKVPNGSVKPPLVSRVPATEMDTAHGFAQDVRFSAIYQPATNQLPSTAQGVNNIPQPMLPPPGTGHYWHQGQTTQSGQPQYGLFANQFLAPPPTLPLTFGDPNTPSLVMNQSNLNLGMYIHPSGPAYLEDVTRSTTTYGGIGLGPTGSNRVRGHPNRLKQNQISTDDPNMTMDADWRAYTDESDSTKTGRGGMSTWRSNQIEAESTKRWEPFTQVNANPVIGPLGIAQPPQVYFRRPDATQASGYDDILMDNTGTTDYINVTRPPGVRQQAYQTQMGRQAAQVNPYPEPEVHEPGEDFDDPDKDTYPGYMTPPPTPFLAESGLSGTPFPASVPGRVRQGQRVTLADGRECQVIDVIAYNNGLTACRVLEIPKTEWPNFF